MPDYTIIDGHVHLTSIDNINGLLEVMDATGLSAVNLLAMVNQTPPWWAEPGSADWNRRTRPRDLSENVASLMCKALHPDRVFVFGGLDHHTSQVLAGHHDYAQQAHRLIEMGVDGFKMWEGGNLRVQTGLPLDSPVFDEYYSLLESKSLPILYHVNAPYRHEVDGLLQKHPNLKIIFAHFYGAARELDRLRRFLDSWPNTYVDLAPGMIFRGLSENRDEAREFFIEYQDRILFGTDTAPGSRLLVEWFKKLVHYIKRFLQRKDDLNLAEIEMDGLEDANGDLDENLRLVLHELHADRGLYLDDDVLRKIYAGNFFGIVGAEPRKVNPRAVLSECERLIKRVLQEPDNGGAGHDIVERWLGGACHTIHIGPHKSEHLQELQRIADTFRTMSQQQTRGSQ
jgi:hypothetical protein